MEGAEIPVASESANTVSLKRIPRRPQQPQRRLEPVGLLGAAMLGPDVEQCYLSASASDYGVAHLGGGAQGRRHSRGPGQHFGFVNRLLGPGLVGQPARPRVPALRTALK